MERDWHENPEDEREVDLNVEEDPVPPPTIDPDERIELDEPDLPLPDDERPV